MVRNVGFLGEYQKLRENEVNLKGRLYSTVKTTGSGKGTGDTVIWSVLVLQGMKGTGSVWAVGCSFHSSAAGWLQKNREKGSGMLEEEASDQSSEEKKVERKVFVPLNSSSHLGPGHSKSEGRWWLGRSRAGGQGGHH